MPTAVAEHSCTVTPSRRDILVKSFGNLSEALEHALGSLAARGHGYRITLRGDDAAPAGWTLQVVDQDHVFGDGQFGLTVVISAQVLARLEGSRDDFEQVAGEQDSCFVTWFGADAKAAECLIERLLPEASEQFWTVCIRTTTGTSLSRASRE